MKVFKILMCIEHFYLYGAPWHRTNLNLSFQNCCRVSDVSQTWLASDGFFRKDYGNRNRKQLCSRSGVLCETGNRKETTYWPGRPARPPEVPILRCQSQIVFPDFVAHRTAYLLEFWINFSRVSLTQKTCFQTQKCWRFAKFTFWESNI